MVQFFFNTSLIVHTCVYKSPRSWEFSGVECLLDRIVVLHVIKTILHGVIPGIVDPHFVSRFFMVVGMVSCSIQNE